MKHGLHTHDVVEGKNTKEAKINLKAKHGTLKIIQIQPLDSECDYLTNDEKDIMRR